MIQKRGEFPLAFAMYKNRRKPIFDTNAFNGANQRKIQCLCGFIALGVIIPHSSIRQTMPVAFIYKSLLNLQIVLLVFAKQGDLYCAASLFANHACSLPSFFLIANFCLCFCLNCGGFVAIMCS